MITFTLILPALTDKQQIMQIMLEEMLLKLPQVDAMALDNGDFSITTARENKELRGLVAVLYSWASNDTGMLQGMNVVCEDGKTLPIIKHSPNDVIYFLATC